METNDSLFDVAIIPCERYDAQPVETALEKAISVSAGWNWLRPGMTVAVKTNLVAAMKKERAATTHPTVLAALTRLLLQKGAAKVIIGDSPGSLFNEAVLQHAYDVSGLSEAVQAGAELNHNFEIAEASYPDGIAAKHFSFTAWLKQADVIVDVCKLKSHGMMGLSAAAKNMFGVIPGMQKPEYHFRFPNVDDFAQMIIDLDTYFHPALCIADGIVCMEGNGPTQGTPRSVGVLMASASPHTLDLAAVDLLGMDVQSVPTVVAAQQRGLIPPGTDSLKIYGDIQRYSVPDFKKIDVHNDITFRNMAGGGLAGRVISSFAARALNSQPKPVKKECISCGKCAGLCPAKAISMQNGQPVIDRNRCIRCFCCQEFCPVGAMKVHRTWLAKLLTK